MQGKAQSPELGGAGSHPMANILTINGGSSSIRFALFACDDPPRRLLQGKIERVGSAKADLVIAGGEQPSITKVKAHDSRSAIDSLAAWLSQHAGQAVDAIGHRVVHGLDRMTPERVSVGVLKALKRLKPYDPEHLPREIELIESLARRYRRAPQVVCYDTAFHRDMPQVAKLLALPRRYLRRGIRRYGFHGLSYTYLLEALKGLGDPAAVGGRVILAHLGSGASMAAVRCGHCIDTSMGFTPTAGFMMSTRSGDLDPGIMGYLARRERLSSARLQRLVNHESGLLGVSGISGDVRDLLACETKDFRAEEALDLFSYQVRKWLGAFTATLGGLDTLVFSGGVGENSAPMRARICQGLGFFGIELDEERNARHAAVISRGDAGVCVRVIPTDEEMVIARTTQDVLQLNRK